MIRATGENIPLADRTFDSVVTTLVLCTVKSPELVLSEVKRVLKPGGTLFFYEHVGSDSQMRRRWENGLNPIWRFLTTGCNLNRDTERTIRSVGFTTVEVDSFDLSVGIPVTLPNIIGAARN